MSVSRFLLHGINGVHNYGCEAIVRGTVKILERSFPDVPAIYLSRRPEQDREALKGCPVTIEDNSLYPRWHPRRGIPAAVRRLHLAAAGAFGERFRNYGPGDCVLSIGGDILTLGPEPYPKRVTVPAVDRLTWMKSRGARVVLWAASVGPFEDWPQSVPVYRRCLEQLDLITVREPRTARYLRSLRVSTNVRETGDPAFLMDGLSQETAFPFNRDDGRPVLGVNLSPLSSRYEYGPDLEEAVRHQSAFLQNVAREHNLRLLLIPHVVASHRADDDHRYMARLRERLLLAFSEDDVKLLSPDMGARRTKQCIANCDALIAARMHCGIAGVSTEVPTVFLAYSAKARAMAEWVYGDDTLCRGLRDFFSASGVEALRWLIRNRNALRRELAARQCAFRAEALSGGNELQKVLR